MEQSGRERRLAERVFVNLEVDYRAEATYLFAYITDMSSMGIFIRTNEPEPPGTLINMRFIPPGESESMELEGVVTWINPFRPGDIDNLHPGMGIRFAALDLLTRERLVALVRRLAFLENKEAAQEDGSSGR